jgi:hypothetical protein
VKRLSRRRRCRRAPAVCLAHRAKPSIGHLAIGDQAEAIKKDPAAADAAVVMLTSAGQRGDAARCRELGVAAWSSHHHSAVQRQASERVPRGLAHVQSGAVGR